MRIRSNVPNVPNVFGTPGACGVGRLALLALSIALPLALTPVAAAATDSFADFANAAPSAGDIDFVRAHVRFLSDDLLEGRAPGTRGGELAAAYLASQLALLGVEPGGEDGTYFQKVPLLGLTTDLAKSSAAIRKPAAAGGDLLPLTLQEDFVAADEVQREEGTTDAEIVFCGYGIVAPEQGWDDFKGVDLKGKVMLVVVNDPPSEDPKVFGGKGLTYYGRWTYKYEEAARRGAAGCVIIHRDDLAGYGFHVVRTSFARERPYVDLRNDAAPRLGLAGWLTEGKAKEVLALAGQDLDDLLAKAATKEFAPIPLGIELEAKLVTQVRAFETPNVIGVVRGAKRAQEAIVFSAHYDHLGVDDVKVKAGEDGIYNGAIDNATGCAALLWLAREFVRSPARPDRSIAFLFTTAEEGGLRGSEYYASHPTFAIERIAADLNLDGLAVVGEPLDFEPLGYDRSTLKKHVELAAREFDVALLPDSNPEFGLFYRSDHFPFAKAGVPAINLKTGKKLKSAVEGAGEAFAEEYRKDRYHQPADEYDPSWDFIGLVKTARFAGRIAWRVAHDPELPRYNPGDEFERK
jgi:Zn-dependent M28 family amino/carboxypeptidase